MYCPRCAAQNLDNARFCRACGADISLVPQALTGRLPTREPEAALETSGARHRSRAAKTRGNKEKELPTLEAVVKNIFMGVAFMLIFIAGLLFFRHAFPVWFWAVIPGLACLGEGVGQHMRLKRAEREQQALNPAPFSTAMPPLAAPPRVSALAPHETSEIIAPPGSITEGTTRHLGVRKERAD